MPRDPAECLICGFNVATPRDVERWRSRVDVLPGQLAERLPDGSIAEANTSLCWNIDLPACDRLHRDEETADAETLRAALVRLRRQYNRVVCSWVAAMKGHPV